MFIEAKEKNKIKMKEKYTNKKDVSFLRIVRIVFRSLLLLFLLKIFVFDFYLVDKISMRPQILSGELAIAEKISLGLRLPCKIFSYHFLPFCQNPKQLLRLTPPFRPLQKNDVIIFYSRYSADPLIKNIVATQGDKLSIDANGLVWLEQKPKKVYLFDSQEQNTFEKNTLPAFQKEQKPNDSLSAFLKQETETYVIPEHCFFVLGNNRKHSIDSRAFGLVQMHSVIGRVIYTAFPLQ